MSGVDVSELMLARARSMPKRPGHHLCREDLETIKLKPKAYGLVYSSLPSLLAQPGRPAGEVRSALTPRGRSVFSVEHPS